MLSWFYYIFNILFVSQYIDIYELYYTFNTTPETNAHFMIHTTIKLNLESSKRVIFWGACDLMRFKGVTKNEEGAVDFLYNDFDKRISAFLLLILIYFIYLFVCVWFNEI